MLAPVARWAAAEHLIEATLAAFRDGADVPVRVRCGAVVVPDEVADRTAALALAEERLDVDPRGPAAAAGPAPRAEVGAPR